jgi:uncharacterized membrane protein
MRNRILAAVVMCAATTLIVACPRSTQPSPPAADKEPVSMSQSDSAAASGAKGKRAAGQENEPLMAWRAFGTEPFWQARVDGDDLYFSTPDDQEGKVMHGRRVPSLVGFVYAGKDGDKDFHLDISPGECSDGMSDNRYDHVATFIYGATTYKGCGEAAK